MDDDAHCSNSAVCLFELSLCAASAPFFITFYILQIRAEKLVRPACRATATVCHRYLLFSSVLLLFEAPLFYLQTNADIWLFGMLLLRYINGSVLLSCVNMICYHIIKSFYKSLFVKLPPFTKRTFGFLSFLSLAIATVAPLMAYGFHILWPFVIPTFTNSLLLLILVIILTRYWLRAGRLVDRAFGKHDEYTQSGFLADEFGAPVAVMGSALDDSEPLTPNSRWISPEKAREREKERDKEREKEREKEKEKEKERAMAEHLNQFLLSEQRARTSLSRLRALILALSVALIPVIMLSAFRSLDFLTGEDTSNLEKSQNSVYLVVVGVLLLAFGAWYAWIPMPASHSDCGMNSCCPCSSSLQFQELENDPIDPIDNATSSSSGPTNQRTDQIEISYSSMNETPLKFHFDHPNYNGSTNTHTNTKLSNVTESPSK